MKRLREIYLGLGKSHAGRLFVCAFFIFMYWRASTKPTFRYDTGLHRAEPTLATNDTVTISWTYDVVIRPDTPVFIDCRALGAAEQEDWIQLAETTVGAGSWTGTLAGATNYAYLVYSVYVPPPPVHTNGVYHLNAARAAEARVVTPAVEIRVNGERVAPPRKESTP